MTRSIRLVVVAVTLVMGCATAVRAQDSHYWTQQYGTRAELVGGLVVGAFLDLSAAYYNPGALALTPGAAVLLSANAVEYQKLTVGLGLDGTQDLKSDRFSSAPTLFAGLLPWKPWQGRLAYSGLTRQDFEATLNGKKIIQTDALPGLPGPEDFSGEVYLRQDINEMWYGLTWSRAFNDHFGFGISPYGVYRGQNTRRERLGQAVSETSGDGASTTIIDEVKYWNFRWLAKLGVAFKYDPVDFGVAIQTPSINFLGKGSYYYDRAFINLDLDQDGTPESALAASYQPDLPSTYKSGLSIAAGATYRMRNRRLYGTLQWFNSIPQYDVLDPVPFQAQTNGNTITPEVTDAVGSVFNWGVGFEHHLRERFTYYISFYTDYSASSEESTIQLTKWDIFHIAGGSGFTFKGLDLTLGFDYAWGSNDNVYGVNFQDPSESNQLLGSPLQTTVSYRKIKAILGFSFSV